MSVNLLWFDAETSGLDLRNDNVLEVAWTITDHDGVQLTPLRQHLTHLIPPGSGRPHVHPANAQEWHKRAPALVQDMHERSGLTAAWRDAYPYLVASDAAVVEEAIRDDLTWAETRHRKRGGSPVTRTYLAGAGVSHFDHELLGIHMPKLGGRGGTLHYRDVDVSVTLCTLAGGDHEASSTSLNDTVLSDTLQHLHERTEACYGEQCAAGLLERITWVSTSPDLEYDPEQAAKIEKVAMADDAPHRAGADVIRALTLFRLLRHHSQALMLTGER